DHANHFGGKSVWWSWTALNSNPVFLDTAGTSFSTLLAVYTGDSVTNLVPIASDSGGVSGPSRVSFVPAPGITYQIAVDGLNGDAGNIRLNLGINIPPRITAQPQGRIVNANTSTTTAVTASGTDLTYQWKKNGIPLNDGN